MGKTTTLADLAHFCREEKKMLKSLGLEEESMDMIDEAPYKLEPKKETVNNILNYSKALSVRKSKVLGSVEFVLN